MTFPLYYYKATCLRVVDGDTAVLRIDRGFREFWEISCRLSFINAPELSTGEPGQQAKTYLGAELLGRPLWIRSDKMDNYGRPLVTIWTSETTDVAKSVNMTMIALGHAKPYGAT